MRPYFVKKGLGRIIAGGMVTNSRPASFAMTRASGTFGLPALIAAAVLLEGGLAEFRGLSAGISCAFRDGPLSKRLSGKRHVCCVAH
jgi:hypothetical protein